MVQGAALQGRVDEDVADESENGDATGNGPEGRGDSDHGGGRQNGPEGKHSARPQASAGQGAVGRAEHHGVSVPLDVVVQREYAEGKEGDTAGGLAERGQSRKRGDAR